MEKERLQSIIEAVVFASGEAICHSDIISKLDATKEDYNEAVEALKQKYNNSSSGVTMLEFNGKIQLSSASHLKEEVMLILSPVRERALSKSTIETLSIIAYKQPITRLEIEEIRGVSSDYALNVLLDHKLIEVVGKKDALGKPLLFGTTDEFLKRFNLENISSLPDKESLMGRIETIRRDGDGLYREYDIPDEEIIPEKVLEKLSKSNGNNSATETPFNLVDPSRSNDYVVDDDFKFV